ncbi:MAG: GAF domain-containing sensor histidine kinase [Gemmatimonadota bacterium]|nr:MAG: GAF domain-containing sensor histidine kinase [Gemmatimonadota bacterium]
MRRRPGGARSKPACEGKDMTSSSKTIVEVFCELAGLRGRSNDQADKEASQEVSLETLTTIAEGTAVTTGEEFFRALVRHVAGALEVRHAMIAEVTEARGRVRTLAQWDIDRFLDNIEYDVAGTPCEPVLLGETRQYVHSVSELFPGSASLAQLGIESYLSIPLKGSTGEILGNLVVMDDTPMPEDPRDLPILQIFAARAAAELERMRTEEELHRTETRLLIAEKMAALSQMAECVVQETTATVGTIESGADVSQTVLNKIERLWDEVRPAEAESDDQFQHSLATLRESAAANAAAGRRMAGLAKSLEKFTQLDDGEFQLVDLREELDSSIGLLETQLGVGVRLEKRYEDIPRVRAHPSELGQVFMTLLTNANEAIEGHGTITISTVADGSDVFVTVADTGRGIPSDELTTLFEIGSATNRSAVRMRFGLANAYNIVKKHCGELDVLSEVGKGTAFTIKLPID